MYYFTTLFLCEPDYEGAAITDFPKSMLIKEICERNSRLEAIRFVK